MPVSSCSGPHPVPRRGASSCNALLPGESDPHFSSRADVGSTRTPLPPSAWSNRYQYDDRLAAHAAAASDGILDVPISIATMVPSAHPLDCQPLVGGKAALEKHHFGAPEPRVIQPIGKIMLLAQFGDDRAQAAFELRGGCVRGHVDLRFCDSIAHQIRDRSGRCKQP